MDARRHQFYNAVFVNGVKVTPDRCAAFENIYAELKAIGKKGETTKTLFTTVADSYEALVALYQAGVKHYSIVYSLKKIAKTSRYNLGEVVTEEGVKLSELSKKDRMKQLF